MRLTKSTGDKRKVASGLAAISGVISVIPGVDQIITLIDLIGSAVGLTGITHAGLAGTLTKEKLASLASLLLLLATVCEFHPTLKPYAAPLRELAALFGATVIGKQVGAKKV